MAYPAKIDIPRILAAATEVIEATGPEPFSLRAVAARLGVAPNALYRHFPDRECLIAACADAGITRLLAQLSEAAENAAAENAASEKAGTAKAPHPKAPTPEALAPLLARTYLDFAARNPNLYTVMIAAYEGQAAAYFTAHHRLWQHTNSLIAALTGAPADGPNVAEASLAIWAYLHGLALLRRTGILTGAGKPQGDAAATLARLLTLAAG